ncbi:excinuclease ABC subunit UvrC [Bacteroidales bacterium OttesenSCG-928-C19]|nr:excinuclease ABC subunit UvrC [Bacteroidales bacterium OttesenSCG-928-C19]
MNPELELQLKTIPEQPGVYQYFDKQGEIIYIGKARDLRKRVNSYFQEDRPHSIKIRLLIKKIENLKYIVVDTELDALLLENTLIKKHQPRYNTMLKDDKSYPWLAITNEEFPRFFSTHNQIKDGTQYFGPYPIHRVLRELQALIRKLFKYRTCKLKLTEEDIQKQKFKPCINLQIGLCNAPCDGKESKEDYNNSIKGIKEILKGNFSEIIDEMKEKMMEKANNLQFEEAQELKEKIMALEQYRGRSTIVGTSIKDEDVYSILSDEKNAYINVMRIKNGAIVLSYSTEVKKHLDESDEEILTQIIPQLHEKTESTAKEIIVPIKVDIPEEYLAQSIPIRGDRKKLLELSQKNARTFMMEKKKQLTLIDPERRTKQLLETAMKDLHLPVLPERIECFDNSNTQGTYPVSAMVCFINGKPAKREYRHFIIRTVDGPDDFKSMAEVVHRRYKRVLEENAPLPQLIVVDGGKGQLSSAISALKQLKIYDKVTIIGIAERLEEIYFPGDSIPLHLDKRSETLKLIQQLRDEAHRFGITHHRKRRSKGTIFTSLTDIPGIGEKTARDLLLRFASVKNIRNASLKDLAACIGNKKAEVVWKYFNSNEDE